MGQATYLAILFITITGPAIAMAVSPRLRLTPSDWSGMRMVFMYVSAPFVLLDVLQHARGWWSYNQQLVMEGRILGLPFEEILFFFAIPFSCLYIYTLLSRIRRLTAPAPAMGLCVVLCVALLGAAAVMLEPKERTIFDTMLCFAVVGLIALAFHRYVISVRDVVWVGVVTVLFAIVNGILTSIPVVVYNHMYGSSLVLGTIPVADVLYNTSLLVSAVAIYRHPWAKVDRLS